jgi:hypothetical protein
MKILSAGLAAGLLASLCGAASALDYREARHGDLPWEGTPAQLSFDYGTNTVSGRMEVIVQADGTAAIDLDPFMLMLPEGAALLSADVAFLYGDTTRNTANFNLDWYITVNPTARLCLALEAPSENCVSSGRRGNGTLFNGAAIAPFGLFVSPGVSTGAEDWSRPYGGRVAYMLTFEVGSPPPLPVPEPATWTLMALGVAGLLVTARSKRAL